MVYLLAPLTVAHAVVKEHKQRLKETRRVAKEKRLDGHDGGESETQKIYDRQVEEQRRLLKKCGDDKLSVMLPVASAASSSLPPAVAQVNGFNSNVYAGTQTRNLPTTEPKLAMQHTAPSSPSSSLIHPTAASSGRQIEDRNTSFSTLKHDAGRVA